MTIRMGYWDCPSCSHKKNLGPNPTCAQCGRPRGPNIPFYTDESAPVVEDPVGTPAYRGREAVRAFWNRAAWPGVEFNATLHKLIACGREALAHFTIRLVAAARPTMSIDVHEIVRFADDGRIAELRAFWNESNLGIES